MIFGAIGGMMITLFVSENKHLCLKNETNENDGY
jgi:hypothetical protein